MPWKQQQTRPVALQPKALRLPWPQSQGYKQVSCQTASRSLPLLRAAGREIELANTLESSASDFSLTALCIGIALIVLGGFLWYESKRRIAQDVALKAWKRYQLVEQAQAEGQLDELTERRRAMQEAKDELADVRKLRVGPWEFELLPQVKEMATSSSKHHPSALRNRGPILEQLQLLLGPSPHGRALEIGSCSGAHIEVFAPAFPDIDWQPSDRYPTGSPQLRELDSIGRRSNVRPSISLDASRPFSEWPLTGRRFHLVFSSNITHCTAWTVTSGLIAGASHCLELGGYLVIYGPFTENGQFSSEGNVAFDKSLRAQNAEWGYRDVEAVALIAQKHKLGLEIKISMPANNLLLVFTKRDD